MPMIRELLGQDLALILLLIGCGAFILASSLQFRKIWRRLGNKELSPWLKAYSTFALVFSAAFIVGIIAVLVYFFVSASLR
jgi:hypothetical protein